MQLYLHQGQSQGDGSTSLSSSVTGVGRCWSTPPPSWGTRRPNTGPSLPSSPQPRRTRQRSTSTRQTTWTGCRPPWQGGLLSEGGRGQVPVWRFVLFRTTSPLPRHTPLEEETRRMEVRMVTILEIEITKIIDSHHFKRTKILRPERRKFP